MKACIKISGQRINNIVCNGHMTDLFLVLSITAAAMSKRISGPLSTRLELTERSINSTVYSSIQFQMAFLKYTATRSCKEVPRCMKHVVISTYQRIQ